MIVIEFFNAGAVHHGQTATIGIQAKPFNVKKTLPVHVEFDNAKRPRVFTCLPIAAGGDPCDVVDVVFEYFVVRYLPAQCKSIKTEAAQKKQREFTDRRFHLEISSGPLFLFRIVAAGLLQAFKIAGFNAGHVFAVEA